MDVDLFFATAKERYLIRMRRSAGVTPWTEDPIFKEWRFCNVYREHDKTTEWLRLNVREPLASDSRRLIFAVVAFRWFNRIEVGERILDLLLNEWDSKEALRRLEHVKPVTNGAYVVKTPTGMSKLQGVLWCVNNAEAYLQEVGPSWGGSLKGAHQDLQQLAFMGPFMAYEIVRDLRWTPVLSYAQDVNHWANVGPGCARGVGRLVGGDPKKYSCKDQQEVLGVLRRLLELSREHWSFDPPWELQECEHWTCEYDKYMRVLEGERMKQRYKA